MSEPGGPDLAALLRSTLEAALDGVLVVSPHGSVLAVNDRFLELWGLPAGLVGPGSHEAALGVVAPQLAEPEAFLRRVRELYATGAAGHDRLLLRDGRTLDRYGTPLTGAPRPGYAWFVRDVTAQSRAQEALGASEARYRSLVEALSREVFVLDADGRLTGDLPVLRAATGLAPEALTDLAALTGVDPVAQDGVRRSWERSARDHQPFAAEFPIATGPADPVTGVALTRTLLVRAVPLVQDGRLVEWVGVYDDVTDERAAERERVALTRAAAAAAEDVRALQEVTAALSGAVSLADVLTVILDQGAARLGADGRGVALVDGDRVRYEVLGGYSADIRAAWAEWPLTENSPVTHVIRSGRPVFVQRREDLPGWEENDRLRDFVDSANEHAWARLPLVTPRGVLGALIFGFERSRSFTVDERNFALALAGQCAHAIERARLYDRERSTARQLQRSLLPEALPTPPGLQLSAACHPAAVDVEIGGDWYDAVVLDDGRTAVVVGDVMGKDVHAASVMGQVRNGLRGLLQADPEPAVVVARLDRLVRAGADEELVTLVYGVFDPAEATFAWANAGHPPPLLVEGSGVRYLEAGAELPLGLGGERTSHRVQLAAGAALVLYSDGLVENRRRSLSDGLPQLAERATAMAGADPAPDADALRAGLTAAMVDAADTDDITVLVLRHAPAPAGPVAQSAQVVLPMRASSAGQGRAFATEALQRWGLVALEDVVLLGVSELVTNAVVHAASRAEVTLRVTQRGVRVEVRDTAQTAVAPTLQHAADSDTHGRGLLLIDVMSDRWGVVDEPDGTVVWFETDLPA